MRYTTDAIRELWNDEWMLGAWAEVEQLALQAMADIGQIPQTWADEALHAPLPTVQQWRDETTLNGHEVVAFLSLWSENGAKHTHIGLTSSDITDTTLGLRVQQTTEELHRSLHDLIDEITGMWDEIGHVPRVGRTHGQPAIATTYGSLLRRWVQMLSDAATNLSAAGGQAAIGKASGPIGTYANIDRAIEQQLCDRLDLLPARGASQIVPRLPLANWVAALGLVATSIDAIATELRLLGHADIGEAVDTNGSTSSAMPHKRNPNRLERLTGLARVVRNAYDPISEGIVQWHERDMAHSSVERTLLPQAAGITAYMVESLRHILAGLQIDQHRVAENLQGHEIELLTHSLQTYLQLHGETYLEARASVRTLLRENVGIASLRHAIRYDPRFDGWTQSNTTREETLNGIL